MNSTHHFHLRLGDDIDVSSADIEMGTVVFRLNGVTFYVPTERALEFVHAVATDWSQTARDALSSQV